jgi:dolichol-phosphate mannosyltransferase
MIDASRSWQSLLSYVGFKNGVVEVEHSSRYEGKSSYSWKRLYKLSMDIILSNSNKPLKFAINIGGIITLISLIMVVYNLIVFLIDDVLPGFSSTMIAIWFVGGVNVFLIGVIGLYIDKIFNQVKSRPLYIISEILNGKE